MLQIAMDEKHGVDAKNKHSIAFAIFLSSKTFELLKQINICFGFSFENFENLSSNYICQYAMNVRASLFQIILTFLGILTESNGTFHSKIISFGSFWLLPDPNIFTF